MRGRLLRCNWYEYEGGIDHTAPSGEFAKYNITMPYGRLGTDAEELRRDVRFTLTFNLTPCPPLLPASMPSAAKAVRLRHFARLA